jgi:hypothetical protein
MTRSAASGSSWAARRSDRVRTSATNVTTEDFYNTHRLHRTLNQAASLRPLPDGVTDLDHFRVRLRDRAGGVIHEYRLGA